METFSNNVGIRTGLNPLLFWCMLKVLGRANEFEDEDGDVDDEDVQNLSLVVCPSLWRVLMMPPPTSPVSSGKVPRGLVERSCSSCC